MQKKIVIVGAGFSGTMSALSAARVRAEAGAEAELDIVVVAPEAVLTIRPRLYEDYPELMGAPLDKLFEVTGIRFIDGLVREISAEFPVITVERLNGEIEAIVYDRLVLAAGSRIVHPPIPGLADHAFSVDQRNEADVLWQHVHALANLPRSPERDTVVVAGGGFTGIETAAEMPVRLRSILGDNADVRVVVVERAPEIGPDLGPGPRPVIEEAMDAMGVELVLGKAVTSVDSTGVTLEDGTRIPSKTVIWTGGMRASSLAEMIDAPKDVLGRLVVDRHLRVGKNPAIFASGDMACAVTDDFGHNTLMACQHAMPLGRFSGHNAAADLLGRPVLPYSQERYVTCLDLGPWGAVFCEGWDRKVVVSGVEAKKIKSEINSVWIYPPEADREKALAASTPGITADV